MKRLDHYWYSVNLISLLLLPLSILFCIIGKLRKLLYKTGVLKSYAAPVPVIVVGNISVGGTGKTPLIVELVKQLQVKGKNPGVISRGYGGNAKQWPQPVSADSSAELVGDEPVLIQNRTSCPVVVGPNREDDINLLLENHECDVILSDDGMQHYAMQRKFEIAVVDAERQFGNGFCLPSGPLRENRSRLKKVDMVLLNGGDTDQVSFSMQSAQCCPLDAQNEKLLLSAFSGKKVHAVAGIGNPERFFNMLRNNNINVVEHVFNDHFAYKEEDLIFGDQLPVLMTEKDAVKCKSFTLDQHWYVPVDITLSETAQIKIDQFFNSL